MVLRQRHAVDLRVGGIAKSNAGVREGPREARDGAALDTYTRCCGARSPPHIDAGVGGVTVEVKPARSKWTSLAVMVTAVPLQLRFPVRMYCPGAFRLSSQFTGVAADAGSKHRLRESTLKTSKTVLLLFLLLHVILFILVSFAS